MGPVCVSRVQTPPTRPRLRMRAPSETETHTRTPTTTSTWADTAAQVVGRVVEHTRHALFEDTRHVVLGGGAMYGIMYIGVLMQLCGHDVDTYKRWVHNVRGVAGTSAGAIVGFLLAAGLSPWAMLDTVATCGLPRVMKGMLDLEPAAVARTNALTSGEAVEEVCRDLVRRITGSSDTTLSQFFRQTGKQFVVVVTNLDTQSAEFWDHVSEPDLPVWLAIRATSSLPGIFPMVALPDGRRVVDGGLVCNVPCVFPSHSTLTLLVQNYRRPGQKLPPYLLNVVAIQMEAAQTGCLRRDPVLFMRCIPCPFPTRPPRLGRLTFDASEEELRDLVAEGCRAVCGVYMRDVFIVCLVLRAACILARKSSSYSSSEMK